MKLFRHTKSGKIYQVLCQAEHSETHEPLVIYQQYKQDERTSRIIWARPTKMFMEDIELDGKIVPRFEEIKVS